MIPIIDIAPLTASPDRTAAGSGASQERCTAAIHEACVDTGFFVAGGHGLEACTHELFDAGRRFFALPQAQKELVPRHERYGYVPHAATAIDTGRQSTNTEYFDIGLGDEVELPPLEGFESAVRTYQSAALGVGAAIVRSLAISLGLAPDFFAAAMERPQCRLRFLHYPQLERHPDGTLPVPTSPHTDYGLITLLATDGVAGLEVRGLDGEWLPVDAPPLSLVINLGDMLARWTNDRYASTPHRVVGPVSGDRFSIPFFVNPDPDTTIECIPTCVTDANPCRYEPVTAGEFLAMRIDGTAEPYVDPLEGPARSGTA